MQLNLWFNKDTEAHKKVLALIAAHKHKSGLSEAKVVIQLLLKLMELQEAANGQ